MRALPRLFKASLGLGLVLAACGGTAAPSSAPSASVAAPKPAASVAVSAAASKPAASAAASAKPSASAAAKPTATTLPAVAADTTQVTLTKVAIPGATGKTLSADILEVDQAANRLYVADRTTGGIDVFDTSANPAKYITTAKLKGAPNGVAVAKNVNKLIVGEGDNSKAADSPGQSTAGIVDVTDPANPKVLAELSSGGKKRSDEVDYDPNTKRALVANSDDEFATVVDMTNNTILKKIDLPALTPKGGGLEQPRYNPVDKMMYLTGSDDNVIYQIDMNAMSVVKHFDIGTPACNPTGITVNPTTDMGIVVCGPKDPQHVVLWDYKNGKVAKTIDNVGACDGAMYDAKANKFFAGCSNFFRGGVAAIFSGDGSFFTNVPTAVGSHGIAYSEATNTVFTQDQLPNEGVLFSFEVPAKAGGGAASASAGAATGGAASGAAKPAASTAAKPSAS